MAEASSNLSKYIIVFSAVYIGLLVILLLVVFAFDIEAKTSLGVGALIVAGIAASASFARDLQRLPEKRERHKFRRPPWPR